MRYLLSLLSIGWILFSDASVLFRGGISLDEGSLWAAPPFDEVARTPHNLLPSRVIAELRNVCLSCHTDGQVLKEEVDRLQPESSASLGESGSDIPSLPGAIQILPAAPLWSPSKKGQAFSLASSLWIIEDTADRKPFGSSSACLGCHDGALAADVHGERKSPDLIRTVREPPIDHPTGILYPRRPDGIFATERPTLASLRYWSVADRTGEGMLMPSGPVSSFFRLAEGIDPRDPIVTASVVRTSYGVIHCDSCHNPHVNRNPPFLRAPSRELCFVCHDR